MGPQRRVPSGTADRTAAAIWFWTVPLAIAVLAFAIIAFGTPMYERDFGRTGTFLLLVLLTGVVLIPGTLTYRVLLGFCPPVQAEGSRRFKAVSGLAGALSALLGLFSVAATNGIGSRSLGAWAGVSLVGVLASAALVSGLLLRACHRWRILPAYQEGCCRKCGYRLVGLSEPRCPECGQASDPAELRQPSGSELSG